MRILDRYILRQFLRNYAISLFVLIGLYVVLDMVFNFDELVSTKGNSVPTSTFAVLWAIFDYYFYQSFLIFNEMSGVIPIVAAAFTIIKLLRQNELTAMLAAGQHLLRVATPVIIAGAVLNFVLPFVNQELLIPQMIPKLTRSTDQILQQTTKTYPIQAMRDDRGSLLTVTNYTPPTDRSPATMRIFDLIGRDEQLRVTSHLSAKSATWDPDRQKWLLTDGWEVSGLLPNQRRTEPMPVDVYQSNINPEEVSLYHSGNFVELLSTRRIDELLERRESYGAADLLRVKHTRFVQPFLNVVLLLLAISCVLTRETSRLRRSSMELLVLVGACMGVIFLCQQLAGHPPAGANGSDRWPALLAWTPMFLFAPLAVWLLDRIKT